MTLKVKLLNEKAEMPVYKHEGDAGFDMKAVGITTEIAEDGNLVIVYHTGIAIKIPEGFVGLLFQRSSIAKKSLSMCNAVGVIDSGYTGEIMAKFKTNTNVIPAVYKEGEYFVQMVIVPYQTVTFESTDNLGDTTRGDGGFGSTDEQHVE